MRKHRIVQCGLVGTVACLVVTIGSPVVSQDPYVPSSLLGNEVRDFNTAADPIFRFDARASELEKRTSLSKADLEALASDANLAKASVSTLQQALGGTMRKLREAGKWTDHLDLFVEQKARSGGVDDSIIQALKKLGGFRRILEQSAASSMQIGTEIDKRLADLRGRTISQRLFDLILPPVEARSARTSCMWVLVGSVIPINPLIGLYNNRDHQWGCHRILFS